jgi:hypothetical protein
VSNQNYSAFKVRTQNKNVSKAYAFPKSGGPGAEHDPVHKDTITKWPMAGGKVRPPMPTAGFPEVKTRVVSDGVRDGSGSTGRNHFKK